MKVWQVGLPGIVGLLLAGCHSDPSVALLERDNYNKEQEIYRLRNRVDDLEAELQGCSPQRTGEMTPPRAMTRGAMPGEILTGPATSDGGRSAAPSSRAGQQYAVPDRPGPVPDISLPEGLNVSPGVEAAPGEVPPRMRPHGETAPPFSPQGSPAHGPSGSLPGGVPPAVVPSSDRPAQWSPVGNRASRAAVAGDNSAVMQITLHPSLTGGIGSGGPVGDEGLLVVVEPRDLAGNILPLPADISVALLDPALPGEQARQARWDFPATDVERLIRTGSQPGIHLRVPWKSTPTHDRLKVYVRYTTRDGRKLQTERLISVALSGPSPAPLRPIPDAAPVETATRPQKPEWSPMR